LSRRDKVKRDQLAPLIAEGFTEGVPLDRVESELPVKTRPESDPAYMNEQATVPGTRIPLPRFFVEHDTEGIWQVHQGRVHRGARIILLPETLEAMKAGLICLRCMEPQDEPFPFRCTSPPEMGCEYRISDRQLRDIAVEYEGESELGPTPIDDADQ